MTKRTAKDIEFTTTIKNNGLGEYAEITDQDGALVCTIGRLITGTRIHREWFYQLAGMKRESRQKYATPKLAWEAAAEVLSAQIGR
jgi:hypothetical protein